MYTNLILHIFLTAHLHLNILQCINQYIHRHAEQILQLGFQQFPYGSIHPLARGQSQCVSALRALRAGGHRSRHWLGLETFAILLVCMRVFMYECIDA